MRILFVCLGNICRSPTAEAVMRGLVRDAGLEDEIRVESAGIGDWHLGQPPDARAAEAARRSGITLDGVARQVTPADFERFDLLIAMDRENLRALLALAPDTQTTPSSGTGEAAAEKVRLLREHDPDARDAGDLDVPDPYYGGEQGFERVVELVTAACRGLLDELRAAPRE